MWDDPRTGRPFLPRVLIADGGGDPVRRPSGIPSGTLLRDIDLLAVVGRMATRECQVAIDLDSVRGLGGDEAAADFVMDTLGIGIVLSRRAHVAAHVAARGGLGLLHAHAFDSTGIARSLAAAPMVPGIGTVVSPASVLCHMRASERAALRRPVIGYGLLDRRGCRHRLPGRGGCGGRAPGRRRSAAGRAGGVGVGGAILDTGRRGGVEQAGFSRDDE